MSTEQPYDPEAHMLKRMQQRYALRTGGGGIMALAGLAVILGAGLIVASVLWFLFWIWFDEFPIGWIGWFFLYLLGAGFLIFREVKRSNESFFDESEMSSMSNPGDASSFGEYQMDRIAAGGSFAGHVISWGPRALVSGINTIRGNQPMRFRGLLARAATIVVQLFREPDAMPIAKLVQPGENPVRFRETLKWLDDNDYIGLASDGKRVWLASRVRQQLNEEGFHA